MSRSSNDNRGNELQNLDAQLDEYRRSSGRNADNSTRAQRQDVVRNDRNRDDGNDDEDDSRGYDDRRGGQRQNDNRNAEQSRAGDRDTENRANSDRATENRQDDNRNSGQRSNAQSDSENRNTRDTRGVTNVRTFDDGDDEEDRSPGRPKPRDQGGENSNPPRSRGEQHFPEGDSRKRRSPPQEGQHTRKQRSPPPRFGPS